MKPFQSLRIVVVALITVCVLSFTVTVRAQEIISLDAEFAIISRDAVDREPLDSSTSFPASVGKLYCLTKIVNAQDPTEITHVWYYRDTERARVTLAVNSSSWRTYSSKVIQPHEVGTWYVDILDPEGDLLVSVPFEITR